MRAAVDSATLISLAWAGQLDLLGRVPLELVVPAAVRRETIADGLAHGYPDAAAIEQAIKEIPDAGTDVSAELSEVDTVDGAVLDAGRKHGALLTNDVALGRRAANLGVRWLRTADLVVLCVRSGTVSLDRGRGALRALHDSGRITETLLRSYLEEL